MSRTGSKHSYAASSSESSLGLNDHHQSQVVNYMRFARFQRGQRLRAVDMCFEDLKDSRLVEDTFTIDEVTEMLDGLLAVVRGEVESELINTAHSNVLLLRQLCQQAEQWHLKLAADISELENRELLEHIKDLEDAEFSGHDFKGSLSSSKLQPLNETGGAALLQIEIQRLNEENGRLKERLQHVESQAVSSARQRGDLQAALDKASSRPAAAAPPARTSDAEVEALRRQLADLKAQVDQSGRSSSKQSERMEGELSSTKHELLRIQEMLELAEKELEKKVSQTAPFRNLKQMLQKKNEQMKDLRKRLSKYEDPE